ncbi:MAG TPA: peptidoglycan-binding protein [Bacilli bacterium]|nr:peptidoglycan-binding protein [Bacilli bacterium]
MITAQALIAKFQYALDQKWGYIWGGTGQTWTQAKQDAATRSMTVKYGSRWIGRRVADCSGLFSWAFKELGGYMYHGSNTMWNKYCTSKGTLQSGITIRPGTAVFLVNSAGSRHHVGLFIGDDTVIEAKGTAYGIVTSKLSHWDEWGELVGVDYTNEGSETVMATLRKGDKGEEVRVLQSKLLALGYNLPKYGADGSYGSETTAAVMAFQTDKGLVADGICGPITQAVLDDVKTEEIEDDATPEMKRVIITASGDGVDIRAGNSEQYSLITTAQNGTSYDWVATAENGWHAVALENQVGWVSGEFGQIE